MGDLALEEVKVHGSLRFKNVTFEGGTAVNLRVILNRAVVKGDLVFDGLTGLGGRHLAISLAGSKISQQLRIMCDPKSKEWTASVSARDAVIGADFVIGGRNNIQYFAYLDCSQMQLGGTLYLGGVVDRLGRIVDNGSLHVEGSINLANARVRGNVQISNVITLGDLSIENILVAGDVIFGRSRGADRSLVFAGGIRASNARVKGKFYISGAKIGKSSSLIALNLTNASIGGSFDLVAEATIEGSLTLTGHLFCKGLRAAEVTLRGVAIEGDTSFDHSQILGGLLIMPAGSHKPSFKGNLLLSALRGRPWLTLRGIAVSGDLRMLASTTRALQITPGLVGKYGEFEIVPPSVGRLLMDATHVHGRFSLAFLQVAGTVSSFGIRGLYIANSTIEGDMLFWSHTAFSDLVLKQDAPSVPLLNPFEYSAAVIGPASIIHSTINGQLNVSFFKSSGSLCFSGTHVKGDALFSSALTASVLGVSEGSVALPRRASASGAVFRQFRVGGDLDLTGLSIFEDPLGHEEEWPQAQLGSIDARQLNVMGQIRISAKLRDREDSVKVPGTFDLQDR